MLHKKLLTITVGIFLAYFSVSASAAITQVVAMERQQAPANTSNMLNQPPIFQCRVQGKNVTLVQIGGNALQ